MKPLVAFVCAMALAGCLAQREDDTGAGLPRTTACSLLASPDKVPDGAPAQGGNGSRPLAITIEGLDGPIAVAVWWFASLQEIHVVRLRGPAEDGFVANVPDDHGVYLLAGQGSWTLEGRVAAGTQDAITLTDGGSTGSLAGVWSEAATTGLGGPSGLGATWLPSDMPWADAEHMDRFERLELTLAWTNAPTGGADFGIAVGPTVDGGFHYVNGAYQANLGPQVERRTVLATEAASLGWDNTTLPRAGPSISTGGFAAQGIPYELSWVAAFRPDPDLPQTCIRLGDVDTADVTSA